MNVLGIGIWEILLILALAFVVLGPQDMGTLGRKAGRLLRTWLDSDEYREIKRTQDVLTNLPQKFMEETGIDENSISPWSSPESARRKAQKAPEMPAERILPDNPPGDMNAEDPLSAWSNPGGTPDEKRQAMLDSVHRNSAQAAPQTNPEPIPPEPPIPNEDL